MISFKSMKNWKKNIRFTNLSYGSNCISKYQHYSPWSYWSFGGKEKEMYFCIFVQLFWQKRIFCKLLIRRGQSLASRKNSLLQIRFKLCNFGFDNQKCLISMFLFRYPFPLSLVLAQSAFISGSFAGSNWIRANLSLLTWLMGGKRVKEQKGRVGKSGVFIHILSADIG